MDDEFVEIPEHQQTAALHALFARDKRNRSLAVAERSLHFPLVANTELSVEDPDRRGMFLADVQRRVMHQGSQKTRSHLRKVYRFSRKQANAIIKEARIELVADMATVREELRALADARLEDIMRRALTAGDLSNEVKALKEYMRLHGLFEVSDTGLGDIADLMRKITAEADGAVVEAEFTVDDETPLPETEWGTPQRIDTLEEDDDDDA